MSFPADDPANKPLVVLVGLMGAGKSSVGRRLAKALGLNFCDSDDEIERAADMSIPDIFETYGEAEFRAGEKRVIERLLDDGPQVLATGGGAFMNDDIRTKIKERAISVWLNADLDTLVERTSRRGGRPLLENTDPRKKLKELMDARYPTYAKADIVIEARPESLDATVKRILKALKTHMKDQGLS